jgi:hypothetical protein
MRKVLLVVGVVIAIVALGMSAALADPPGNNGTVKIDGVDLDQHPNNEPHPGCLFEVDFYGFGANLQATSTFYAWPPTGAQQQVHQVVTTLDDDDSTGGGSEAGYDGGTGLIDLSPHLAGIIPHPNQGFHVKVKVDVPEGSDSNAYSKYKVFWVTCEYPPAPASEGTVTGGGGAGLVSGEVSQGGSGVVLGWLAAAAGLGAVLAAAVLSRARRRATP